MKINRNIALAIWEQEFGDARWATDFAGRIMYIEDFGNSEIYRLYRGKYIYTGWNLHHILPKANDGTNAKFNLTCTNIITNEEAGNKTTFVIDDTIYQVRKNYGKAGHHICEIDG